MNHWDSLQNFGSFRDPAGFVFDGGKEKEPQIFRTVNEAGKSDYEFFVRSGLAAQLQKSAWIIPFEERDSRPNENLPVDGVWKYLAVQRVPFISYPYEWCFHQLRDAAILTLKIQLAALEKGMSLKDASAYNIQMYHGRPIFIDLLSFEKYEEGRPWVAYRQFCMHFLGPLLLMSRRDIRYGTLFRDWIEGFPMDFVSKNLPWKSRFSPSCQIHVHLHAKLLKKYESTRGQVSDKPVKPVPLRQLRLLMENLLAFVQSISAPYPTTEWGDYYNDTNYSDRAFECKRECVRSLCERLKPRTVCDLGANCGEFSRCLPAEVETIISADIDPVAVDKNYVRVRNQKERNLYPILQDLCNPSPGIGWLNAERKPFTERARCDLSLSLALIHHLCIGNNLSFDYVARFLRELGPSAVMEFVPKEDSQTQRLLRSRPDIFPDYSLENCVRAFAPYFQNVERFPVADSLRTLLVFTN